jgi:hypothetical protein
MDLQSFAREALRRLKQPSTMAGLSALGLLFGIAPGTLDVIGQVVVALAGVLAIVLDEQGPSGGVAAEPTIGGGLIGRIADRLRGA